MTRLCFRRQESGRLIAEVEGKPGVVLPATGDRIYATSAANPGVYAEFKVAGRQLFYDQHGDLALVNLERVELPASSPAPAASWPTGTVPARAFTPS
jgi:hypothetical protein